MEKYFVIFDFCFELTACHQKKSSDLRRKNNN